MVLVHAHCAYTRILHSHNTGIASQCKSVWTNSRVQQWVYRCTHYVLAGCDARLPQRISYGFNIRMVHNVKRIKMEMMHWCTCFDGKRCHIYSNLYFHFKCFPPAVRIGDDDLLPTLMQEFPFLHVSPHTAQRMWAQQARHMEHLTRTTLEQRYKKPKTQAKVRRSLGRDG